MNNDSSKMIQFVKDNEKEMLGGAKNKVVRWYFYAQRGLAIINEFRYIFMGVFGIYYFTKMDNPLMLALMFMIAIPILVGIGWLAVHHMSVVLEFLGVRYTTAFGRYSFELQERIVKAVEEMANIIKNQNSIDK